MSVLDREVVEFRRAILDVVARDVTRFAYLDSDRSVGVCPVCGGALGVTFAGTAARADLHCYGGCTEREVIAAIRARVLP